MIKLKILILLTFSNLLNAGFSDEPRHYENNIVFNDNEANNEIFRRAITVLLKNDSDGMACKSADYYLLYAIFLYDKYILYKKNLSIKYCNNLATFINTMYDYFFNPQMVQKIMATSALIACKTLEEDSIYCKDLLNDDYFECLFTLKELKGFELHFLNMIDWNLSYSINEEC
jgi:hypothetical protein